MRKSRIIDSHAHVVQYIAGTGAGGELRSIEMEWPFMLMVRL